MSDRDYLQHGRRHGPQGSDPIPGLSGGGAAAYLVGPNAATITVPNGGTGTQIPVTWGTFQATDSSIFATDAITTAGTGPYSNTAGDKYVYLLAAGAYIVAGCAIWSSGTYDRAVTIGAESQTVLDDIGDYHAEEEASFTTMTVNGHVIQFDPYATRLMYVSESVAAAGQANVRMVLTNFDTADHTVSYATMGIFYLGAWSDLASIY